MNNSTKSLIMVAGCIIPPLAVLLGYTLIPDSTIEQNRTLYGIALVLLTVLAGILGSTFTWGYIKNK